MRLGGFFMPEIQGDDRLAFVTKTGSFVPNLP
jgi:hypothetical protein